MKIKNKGFTLVELLAVIVILGLIALIAVPIVLNNIKKTKEDLYDTQIELIKVGALSYVTGVIADPSVNTAISSMVKSHEAGIVNIKLAVLEQAGAVEVNVLNPFCDGDNKYFSPDFTTIEIRYDGKEFDFDVYYDVSSGDKYEELKNSCVAKRG